MKSLSSVYAASLFSLADEENLLSETMDELLAPRSVFLENADYAPLLDSPTLPLSSRLSLIDEAFGDATEYVKNFNELLNIFLSNQDDEKVAFTLVEKRFNELFDREIII